MELVVAGICCPLKIGIDGGGIAWKSWLLVVTHLKKSTGNNEICTQGPRQDDGKAVKACQDCSEFLVPIFTSGHEDVNSQG